MAHILVLDNDAEFLNTFQQMLEHAGHKVKTASNGKIGTDVFRQARPELLITEIFMPEKDGLETIIEMKRDFPLLKIIAISDGGRLGQFQYLEMATMLGAERSFAKPFRRQEMLQAIQELID